MAALLLAIPPRQSFVQPQHTVRRILTDCTPLSQYTRIIWVSETRREDGKLATDIQYLGRISAISPKEREAIYSDDRVQKVNGAVPFDYGEIAYYNNPDPDKVKLRVNLVNQAITFIDERLKANKPLQVRWAMFYLGNRKAKAGVPVLLKYLDYRYTTCGILEEPILPYWL